jgi:hypothetical protein
MKVIVSCSASIVEHRLPAIQASGFCQKLTKIVNTVDDAELLVAVWDGSHDKTEILIRVMRRLGKPVYTYTPTLNGYSKSYSLGCPRVCQASAIGLKEPDDCGASCTPEMCRVQ